MDHLINNADNPIPDASAQAEPAAEGDDDEDAALAHIKKMGGVDDSELVAKVCNHVFSSSWLVDQMQ